MKRGLKVTAVVATAVIVFLLATLPSRPVETVAAAVDARLLQRTLAGAFHVHTTRSDGAADRAAVAEAARNAGLQFVIFADHGDGTREPDPPAYVGGVLCIDGVEISTSGGHYVALGLRTAAPYPLGGEAAAVVDDVARLGGFGFAAHPDSPRPELAWRDAAAPIDGLEWLNADSEWRDERRARLGRLFVDYWLRPGPAMASMFDRPSATLARWDALAATRPVVAIAGHDAHGGIGRRLEDGSRTSLAGIPSYDASFRSFAVRVVLHAPPGGDPAADGRALLDALRGGRAFTAIDAVAAPAVLDFRARRDGGEVFMGATLPPGGTAHFTARAAVPRDARLVLIRNGEDLHDVRGGALDFSATPAEGAYRIEVRTPGAPGTPPVPWLLGNPVYFLPRAAPPGRPRPPSDTVGRVGEWRIEKDPLSVASLDLTEAGRAALDFTLHGAPRTSQFAALVADLSRPGDAFSRIDFTGRADRPMRISVQLRYPDSRGERWVGSVYLEPHARAIGVAVDSLLPADGQSGRAPETALAGSLLFVVDLTNAAPGAGGRVEIHQLTLVR
jgi:hypothetical protein